MIYLVLDAVTTAAILFVITSGLLIIFGVMKIINFAHAGFLTVGGYVALVATDLEINPWCRASTTLSARDNHLGRFSGR
jgi:branched-chain amino acid transport system permease protein